MDPLSLTPFFASAQQRWAGGHQRAPQAGRQAKGGAACCLLCAIWGGVGLCKQLAVAGCSARCKVWVGKMTLRSAREKSRLNSIIVLQKPSSPPRAQDQTKAGKLCQPRWSLTPGQLRTDTSQRSMWYRHFAIFMSCSTFACWQFGLLCRTTKNHEMLLRNPCPGVIAGGFNCLSAASSSFLHANAVIMKMLCSCSLAHRKGWQSLKSYT